MISSSASSATWSRNDLSLSGKFGKNCGKKKKLRSPPRLDDEADLNVNGVALLEIAFRSDVLGDDDPSILA